MQLAEASTAEATEETLCTRRPGMYACMEGGRCLVRSFFKGLEEQRWGLKRSQDGGQ